MLELYQSAYMEGLSPPIHQHLMNLLDPEFCVNVPTFRKSGIQLYYRIIAVSPDNFPQISYLNMEAGQYLYRVPPFRFGPYLWKLKERIIQSYMEMESSHRIFEIFEKEMFIKMKDSLTMPHYMRRYLKYCRITKRCFNDMNAKKIYLCLSHLLIKSKCKDSFLIREFLETVFVTQKIRDFFLFESNVATKYMCNLIGLALSSKFDMFGLLSSKPNFEKFPICPILGCFLSGRCYKMRILLKYGFQKLPFESIANLYRSGKKNPLYERYAVLELLNQAGIKIRLPDPHWEILRLHRTFLALEIMYFLCETNLTSDNYNWKWKKCYRYLWRSIPDAYFSYTEIKELLKPLSSDSSRVAINSMSSTYRTTFPGANQLEVTPRTLKHLCRCGIRTYLRQNYVLPNGVDLLPLPELLKGYLRLEF